MRSRLRQIVMVASDLDTVEDLVVAERGLVLC
jgi:hypothetical protein